MCKYSAKSRTLVPQNSINELLCGKPAKRLCRDRFTVFQNCLPIMVLKRSFFYKKYTNILLNSSHKWAWPSGNTSPSERNSFSSAEPCWMTLSGPGNVLLSHHWTTRWLHSALVVMLTTIIVHFYVFLLFESRTLGELWHTWYDYHHPKQQLSTSQATMKWRFYRTDNTIERLLSLIHTPTPPNTPKIGQNGIWNILSWNASLELFCLFVYGIIVTKRE